MENSKTNTFNTIFFQEHEKTYEKKVCGYPNKSPEKIVNDFLCRPGCERMFSKHFNQSKIPLDANNKTFNFAGFLHDSLEVSVQ